MNKISLTLSDKILLGNLASHASAKFMLAEATADLNIVSQAVELARNQSKASYFGKLADRLAASAAEQDKETAQSIENGESLISDREAVMEFTDMEVIALSELCINEVKKLEDQITRASLATDVNNLSGLIDDRRNLAFKILKAANLFADAPNPVYQEEEPSPSSYYADGSPVGVPLEQLLRDNARTVNIVASVVDNQPPAINTQPTVDDLIAALSRIPKGTPLSVFGMNGFNPETISVQVAATPGEVPSIKHASLHLWDKASLGDAEGVLGEVLHHDWPNMPFVKRTGHELVTASINEMPMYPPNANPFHYDLSSMGTTLVRGWMIMHGGYDHEEDPIALRSMVLLNTRSGQRFFVDLTRVDETSFIRDKVKPL